MKELSVMYRERSGPEDDQANNASKHPASIANDNLSRRPVSAFSQITNTSKGNHPPANELGITKEDLVLKKYV
jgi:cell division septation protein DedD